MSSLSNKVTALSNDQLLRQGCEQMGIALDASSEMKLLSHLELMAKWNRTHNLTAITEPREMVVQHVLDSLSVVPYLRGKRFLDVGTGGGFPGMSLAILNPAWEVTLLDSRGKRIQFLRHAATRIGVRNLSFENCRIETYQPTEKFDTLTARAFTSLLNMVNWCERCFVPDTRLVAMKGAAPNDELETMRRDVPHSDRWQIQLVKLEVPFMKAERHLVIIDF